MATIRQSYKRTKVTHRKYRKSQQKRRKKK